MFCTVWSTQILLSSPEDPSPRLVAGQWGSQPIRKDPQQRRSGLRSGGASGVEPAFMGRRVDFVPLINQLVSQTIAAYEQSAGGKAAGTSY